MLWTPGRQICYQHQVDLLTLMFYAWEVKIFRSACIRNEKHVQQMDIKQIKMANNQGRKQVIIVKSVICMSVKIVLKNFILVVKYNIWLMLKKKTIEFVGKFDYVVQSHECFEFLLLIFASIEFFVASKIRIPVIRSLWNGATYYQLFHSYFTCSLHICGYVVICCWKRFLIPQTGFLI